AVIDRHDEALQFRKFFRHGAAQIRRECGDAAFARQIIAEESDLTNVRWLLHKIFPLASQAERPVTTTHNMRHAAAFTKNQFESGLRIVQATFKSCGVNGRDGGLMANKFKLA